MLDKMFLERFLSFSKDDYLKAFKKTPAQNKKGKIVFESSLFCNLLSRENVCIPNNMLYYSLLSHLAAETSKSSELLKSQEPSIYFR